MEELLDINNLMYEKLADVNVVANSISNVYNFNPSDYNNNSGSEIVQVEFDEGLDFVDGNNSYIKLRLRVNESDPNYQYFGFSQNQYPYYSLNSGASIMNIFKTVELVTKNGNTLFKEELKNQVQCLREYKINEARKNYLGIMGCITQNSSVASGFPYQNLANNPGLFPSLGSFPYFQTNKFITFVIPLQEISPFFSCCSLIHPKFLNGAILRLTLEKPLAAFRIMNATMQDVNITTPFTYDLTNVSLILSEKELYKEVEDKLNQKMEKEGLNYAYYQSFNTVFNIPRQAYDNESFVFPINLSAGKIKYLAVKPTYTANLTNAQESGGFPMASVDAWNRFCLQNPPYPEDSNDAEFKMRVRLGTNVYPQNYQINSIPDFYNLTTYALNNISFSSCQDLDKQRNKQSPCCVGGNLYDIKEAILGFQDINITTGGLVWAIDFERSQCVSNGGVSTNQERVLSLELSNVTRDAGATAVSLITSVQFLTVVTLFADGSITVNK
jgi:hypothetical protein